MRPIPCTYTISSYGHISFSYTITPHCRAQPDTLLALVCCIHLLYDSSFLLYHRITYTGSFIIIFMIIIIIIILESF